MDVPFQQESRSLLHKIYGQCVVRKIYNYNRKKIVIFFSEFFGTRGRCEWLRKTYFVGICEGIRTRNQRLWGDKKDLRI